MGLRQRLRASGQLPRRSCRKLFACHRCDLPPCPHRRSNGWRRPHSYIAMTVATLHFSRIPLTWRWLFRLCRDSVWVDSAIRWRGAAPYFRITRSWHERSWRSARRPGQGAAGGSSVDPNTAAPVDCGTFLATRMDNQPAALSHQQAFLFSLSRNAARFNQDDQQRPAMPEWPLHVTPSVGPLWSECPTSSAWVQLLQRSCASLLIWRSIQITAAKT